MDYDTNDRLEYSLLAGSKESASALKFFEIHPTQGFIFLKQYPFNSLTPSTTSTTSTFDFRIRVSDSGNPPHQAQISLIIHLIWTPTIQVPHFSQLHYLFAIDENTPVGKLIGHLKGNELTQSRFK